MHQIDGKVLRHDREFSTRLNNATKKIREVWMNVVNTSNTSTEDMIEKLQQLKGKTKLKIYKEISNYYGNMNTRFDEDPFARNAQGISKIYHEVLLLKKFLQTKAEVKNMNINYYDLCYTVIKNRKEIVDDQYESDFISFKDFITPKNMSIKPRESILK